MDTVWGPGLWAEWTGVLCPENLTAPMASPQLGPEGTGTKGVQVGIDLCLLGHWSAGSCFLSPAPTAGI